MRGSVGTERDGPSPSLPVTTTTQVPEPCASAPPERRGDATPLSERALASLRAHRAAWTVSAWVAAAAVWILRTIDVDRTDTSLGRDLVTSWWAERAFAHGLQPYALSATDNRLFLYPPSALVLMRPLAALPLHTTELLGLAATAVLAWMTIMLAAAALGHPWWGALAGVATLGTGLSQPAVAELGLENVTIVCALLLAACYLAAVKDHWLLAGLAIGMSLSLKPLLLPVLAVFLLARKWRALGVAVAVPAVLNAVGFAVVADPNQVWSKLPSILDRTGSGVVWNSAFVDVDQILGIPHGATLGLRAVTVVLALAAAWCAWRALSDPATRIITTSSILLIGTYLAGTLSENHFMLTLVPLAMTIAVLRSPMRNVLAGLGVLMFMGLTFPPSLDGLNPVANLSVFRAAGMLLVLVVLAAKLGSAYGWGLRHGEHRAGRGDGLVAVAP